MRWGLLVVGLLMGCRGEEVETPSPDASFDGASSETAGDSAPVDSSVADTSGVDTSGADAGNPCNPIGNLVPNGDFSMGLKGWIPQDTKTELVAGPCGGQAARLYDVTHFGAISRYFDKKLTKGQKVRLVAWFKSTPASSGNAPLIMAFFNHIGDSGVEVNTDETESLGDLSSTWTRTESVLVLGADSANVRIVAASRSSTLDEFVVGGISLTLE